MRGISNASRTADPWRDLAVIDARAPRTNQAVIGTLALVAFVSDQRWLVGLLALQLVAGLALGRRFCLPCVAYFALIQPLVGEGRLEDSRPPRFANVLGATFLGAATLALFTGAATLGWSLALLVAGLALLAAVTGICVGCELYVLGARLRGTRSLGGA
jgi:hypothetical protein